MTAQSHTAVRPEAKEPRSVPALYHRQAELIWEWRASRLSLVRRLLFSLLGSVLALKIITLISADLKIDGIGPLLLAATLLTVLNSLARPFLLWALSPFPLFAVQVVGLLFEVLVVAGLGRFVQGVTVGSGLAPLRDAVLLTILNAFFAELLRASDDRSYYGTQVRRLAAGRPRPADPGPPGMLVVQIDGLSRPVLEAQIRAGRMPFLARQFRTGAMTLSPWWPLLPPVTPASQAGILHGINDGIPAFRWYEKSTSRLIVANTPEGAAEIVRRISDGRGLLAENGASIGNLMTGDAERCYLTMATIGDLGGAPGDPRTLKGLFVSQTNYLRLAILTLGEILKELYQAERQRSRAIEPRIHRKLSYAFERALTNVALRNLTTALAIEEMFASTPAIYIDYTSYDAVAHHVGPERDEAVDSLEGIDQAIAILVQASNDSPRPYRLVVLSDHGQSLGPTFSQRYGVLLEDVVRSLVKDGPTVRWATDRPDQTGPGGMLLAELARGRGPRRSVLRRMATRAERRAAARAGLDGGEVTRPSIPEQHRSEDSAKPPGPILEPDHGLVGCASGNLALLYFTFTEGRATLEELEERHPGLLDALVAHPGVGIVLVHSEVDGPIVRSANGTMRLSDGRVDGDDPLAPYGPYALMALRRLDTFPNGGDIAVISPIDPVTGEVLSYEELVGSHGGLGGWQQEAFLMRPAEWPLRSDPPVGAPAVHAELSGWLADLATHGDQRPLSGARKAVPPALEVA